MFVELGLESRYGSVRSRITMSLLPSEKKFMLAKSTNMSLLPEQRNRLEWVSEDV